MQDLPIPTLLETLYLLPIAILTVFACIPVTVKVFTGNEEPNNKFSLGIGMVGLALAAASVVYTAAGGKIQVFSGALVFDNLSTYANLAAILISALTLFISFDNVNTRGASFAEHVFLVLLSLGGMMVLVSANDLMVSFVGLELMSIALYILIGIGHEQVLSKEAAFKYFILGSFASAVFLYGIALAYGVTGTTNVLTVATQAQILGAQNQLFLIGLVLLLVGIAFKVSIFPFHAWTPDVYQGAPTSVSAFMATGVKLAMFTLFIRFAEMGLFSGDSRIISALQVLAVLTMTFGNVTALVQENIKRMVAYSSIAHAGYILVGVIVAMASKSPEAATATLYYLLGYSVMNIGAFAVISVFEKENRGHLTLGDYAGLGFKYPLLGLAFAVFMLSLAGIPPTVGFLGKFYLFASAVQEGFVWLAIIGVINSLLSAYYYLRVLVFLYMKEGIFDVETGAVTTTGVVVATTAVLTVGMGVFASFFYSPALKSVLGL